MGVVSVVEAGVGAVRKRKCIDSSPLRTKGVAQNDSLRLKLRGVCSSV